MNFLSNLLGIRRLQCRIDAMEEMLVAKIDDLRAAIAQVGANLTAAVARVEAKMAELGEPDPDMTGDIAKLQDISTQLENLADDTTPDEVPPPDPEADPVE